jgi:5-oxopent-3-ene-1,2,5-tricarboxylate decarboxylase/2-hydroxyhepta-2,4-diene-1,7-dioate isomerase
MATFEELKALSSQTSVATISDVMQSISFQSIVKGIQPITPNKRLFGQAVTVRSLPAREDCIADINFEYKDKVASGDPLMHAIKLCGPEKVLVIETSGYKGAAVGGDTKFAALDNFGAEGLVTDGALRDQREFKEAFNFPSYSAGFTPLVGTGRVIYPHAVNVDISCGGCLVRPDDYIFGDEDGVIVIPESIIEETLNNAIASEKQGLYVRTKSIKEDITYGDIVSKSDEWMPDFLATSDLSSSQKAFFAK